MPASAAFASRCSMLPVSVQSITLEVTLAVLGGGMPCGELACGSAAVLRCENEDVAAPSPAIPICIKRRRLTSNRFIMPKLFHHEIRRAQDRFIARRINRL